MKAVLSARKFGVAVAKSPEHKKLILANLMDYVGATNMVPMPDIPAKPQNVIAYEKTPTGLKAASMAPSPSPFGLTTMTPQVSTGSPSPPPSTAMTTASPSVLAFGAGGASSAQGQGQVAPTPAPRASKLAGFGSQLL
jgi:hypothetical protein